MHLYLMRHGEADPVGGEVRRDAERVLSRRGHDEARIMGHALARLEPGLERILTSPLVRAAESGRIVAGSYPSPPVVEQSEQLSPGFRRLALLKHLDSFGPEARLLLIGHQPDMGELLAWLVAETPQAGIALGTASLAMLTMRRPSLDGEPVLRLLLTPALIETLDTHR